MPALRVAGVIDVTLNVTVEISGGTAVLGTDFSAPGGQFVVTIPAGAPIPFYCGIPVHREARMTGTLLPD